MRSGRPALSPVIQRWVILNTPNAPSPQAGTTTDGHPAPSFGRQGVAGGSLYAALGVAGLWGGVAVREGLQQAPDWEVGPVDDCIGSRFLVGAASPIACPEPSMRRAAVRR